MKRVCIVVSARPSWAKLQTVVETLFADQTVEVDLVACAYALIHRFGRVADVMRAEHYAVTELTSAVDGQSLESSAHTMALTTIQAAQYFKHTNPACVVVTADRHETLGLVVAASYQNIPVVHLQGGETSGNIDHKVRWANSMLSDWHAASTLHARDALVAAGVQRERAWWTGCPSIDVCRLAGHDERVTAAELGRLGIGNPVDPEQPFALVMVHPDTEDTDGGKLLMHSAFTEAIKTRLPIIAFWPGPDAEQDRMAKNMRKLAESWPKNYKPTHFVRTMPPRRFVKLLGQASVAIGNSSCLVREASYLGTPVQIIGNRQRGRERGEKHTYGDGYASQRVVALIKIAMGLESEWIVEPDGFTEGVA